jgi:hypothetical protein
MNSPMTWLRRRAGRAGMEADSMCGGRRGAEGPEPLRYATRLAYWLVSVLITLSNASLPPTALYAP